MRILAAAHLAGKRLQRVFSVLLNTLLNGCDIFWQGPDVHMQAIIQSILAGLVGLIGLIGLVGVIGMGEVGKYPGMFGFDVG